MPKWGWNTWTVAAFFLPGLSAWNVCGCQAGVVGEVATITVKGKTMNGSIRDLSQVVAGFGGLSQAEVVEMFKLAPGSTDKVNGQFTW